MSIWQIEIPICQQPSGKRTIHVDFHASAVSFRVSRKILHLKELIWEELGEAREKREYYLNHMDEVNDILAQGAKKAKAIAQAKMTKVKEAIGLP